MDPSLQEGPQDQVLSLRRRPTQMGLIKAQLMDLKCSTYGEEHTHSLSHSSSLGNPKATSTSSSPHASSSPPTFPLPNPLHKFYPLRPLETSFRPFSPQDSQPLRILSQSLPLTHLFLPSHPVGLSEVSTSIFIFVPL